MEQLKEMLLRCHFLNKVIEDIDVLYELLEEGRNKDFPLKKQGKNYLYEMDLNIEKGEFWVKVINGFGITLENIEFLKVYDDVKKIKRILQDEEAKCQNGLY